MARNQEFSKRDINASLNLSYNFSYFPNNVYIAYNFGLVGQNFRQSGISTNNIIRAITLHGTNSFMSLFFYCCMLTYHPTIQKTIFPRKLTTPKAISTTMNNISRGIKYTYILY